MLRALCSVLAAAALASSARAANDCPTSSARAAYLDGRRALAGGDAAAAVERLGAARRECPAAAVDFYLARAYEQLGRLGLAVDALAKYQQEAPAAKNHDEVGAWLRELQARAAAIGEGLPAPATAHPQVGLPPAYIGDEPDERPRRPTPPPASSEPRWQAILGAGAAWNVGLKPSHVGLRFGAADTAGGAYQLALGYRVSLRARIDLQVILAGQALPWRDAAGETAMFLTMIGVGLRADLPLAGRGRTRLWLSPSIAAGLGSISLGIAATYENSLALRGGLALVVSIGSYAMFVEPEVFVLPIGELPPAWTASLTAGARIRF